MLVIRKGFRKQYRYGGSGLFGSVINAITSTAAKEAAKQVAIDIGKKTATQIGQKAVNKSIDTIHKAVTKKKTLSPKSKQILDSYTAAMIDGSAVARPIDIQDLVKRLSKK